MEGPVIMSSFLGVWLGKTNVVMWWAYIYKSYHNITLTAEYDMYSLLTGQMYIDVNKNRCTIYGIHINLMHI